MVDRTKREELARFLRSRRERLTPEEVGLPAGGRRRTAGLRREEVAVLAGVSPTWYTYLEQARSIHPSREVMESLGAILRFTDDERLYAARLIDGAASAIGDDRARATTMDLLRDVVAQYEDGPFPVYVTDFRCDLVAWNRAACEWYDDWDAMEPEERNLMRWLLRSPVAREHLVNWEEVTRDAVARWRAECAHHPLGRVQPKIDEMAAHSADFVRWWDEHDVLEHRLGSRTFRHKEFGEQKMFVLPLFPPEMRSYGAVFHVPA